MRYSSSYCEEHGGRYLDEVHVSTQVGARLDGGDEHLHRVCEASRQALAFGVIIR